MLFSASLASLDEAARTIIPLTPERIGFRKPDIPPLQPRAVRLGPAVLLPRSGACLTERGLVIDEICVAPGLVRRGGVPEELQPLREGGYVVKAPNALTIDQPVLLINGDGNYYHFLFDDLPRLLSLRRLAVPGLKVLLRQGMPGFVGEALGLAGFPAEAILYRLPHIPIRLADAWVMSNFSYFGDTHPLCFDLLRHAFGALTEPEDVGDEVLFVSRGDAGVRRLTNEAEVLACLAAVGVAAVMPGAMGFRGQIARFPRARGVIGPHGAGLANILWCRPGTPVLEMVPAAPFLMQYRNLCLGLGHPYRRLTAEPEGTAGAGDMNSDFQIDAPSLVQALREFRIKIAK
jgi:capsular polysaccharide biosynthesis protein